MMAGMTLRVGYLSRTQASSIDFPHPVELIDLETDTVEGLRDALLAGHIDIAVHADANLPLDPQFVQAIAHRENPQDAFCGPTDYRGLPHGARVGTDSANRAAQLKHFRSDLVPTEVAGDLEERLAHIGDGLDGIIVSRAELTWHGLTIGQDLPYEVMVPVAGQGALAVEALATSADVLAGIEDSVARMEMVAEQTFTAELGVLPSSPVGVLARSTGKTVALHARFLGDGTKVEIRRSSSNPLTLATDLAAEFVRRGVRP